MNLRKTECEQRRKTKQKQEGVFGQSKALCTLDATRKAKQIRARNSLL